MSREHGQRDFGPGASRWEVEDTQIFTSRNMGMVVYGMWKGGPCDMINIH